MTEHGIGQMPDIEEMLALQELARELRADEQRQVVSAIRNDAAEKAQIQMAEQLTAMNKRLDQEREERLASDNVDRKRFSLNLAVGIVSAVAAIVAAVVSVLALLH